MFSYYLRCAFGGIRRNKLVAFFTIATFAIGIGVLMTALTVLHILSSDPIPSKSASLYHPQLDAASMASYAPNRNPAKQLTRYDAETLLRAKRADRQAMMSSGMVVVDPRREGLLGFFKEARFTTADFFPMFDVPFAHGNGWTSKEDSDRARVAVISAEVNDTVFGGENSVGREIVLNDQAFRVTGVLKPWRPVPQFYDMGVRDLAHEDHVFIPFETAHELDLPRTGTMNCWTESELPETAVGAPCAWVQFWVELRTPERAREYKNFLDAYSAEQRRAGRYERPVNTRLRNVNEWLEYNEAVPDDVKLQTLLAAGFLLLCLINAGGLLLAKFLRRGQEIGVRRALGASRGQVFVQFLVESMVIGMLGAIPGLLLAMAGLWVVSQLPGDYAKTAGLDAFTAYGALICALAFSAIAGALPALRASRIAPAIQLRS